MSHLFFIERGVYRVEILAIKVVLYVPQRLAEITKSKRCRKMLNNFINRKILTVFPHVEVFFNTATCKKQRRRRRAVND